MPGPNTRNQRWMAWSGVASIVILLLGMWAIAGFVPPPGPDKSAQEIVRIYADDATAIRVGIIVAMAGVTLLAPWSIAIALQMRRIEGPSAPLAWLQAILGGLLLLEFYVPGVMWEAAALRPEVDPGFTYRIHDVASILFVALPWSGMLQAIILGIAILQDERPDPVFPRWLAYLSFWAGFSFLPGGFNSLTTTGPIAWNGVLAWWLGLSIFGCWIVAVSICLVKYAIPHQEREDSATRPESLLTIPAIRQMP